MNYLDNSLALEVDNVHFAYGKGSHPVLEGISFGVENGMLCGLVGPNGCGKTTLFKCCLRFLKISKGKITIQGNDIKKLKINHLARLISYVPQEHQGAFPYLVKEVILMGRTPHMHGFSGIGAKDKARAMEALTLIGISDLADKPFTQLSGGQRQLVLIARAIAQETKLMFLDEPTSALDLKNQIKVWEIMRKVTQKGVTVLACCHDPNQVAWFCDRVVVLNHAGIAAIGTPEDVITEKVLDRIYDGACTVKGIDGIKMVLPRNLRFQKPDAIN